MSQNEVSYKFRHNLLGLMGTLLGGAALIITVLHFYSGSVEFKKEKNISYTEMAMNYFKKKPSLEIEKPVYELKTDKNLRIASALLACLALIFSSLSLIKNETKNATSAALYIGLGALGFQLLTHSIVMLIGFILMVFLFSKFNLVK